ncbi:MAG: hypothetical protein IPK81_12270 [Rhodospirillales bacterium]|nr:hypothetical protein [Rhodospirillales bacterium]QQS14846.1 MAG: hypothetical protein IPK81_12270 [Rhodospirillales bacterium]
MPGRIWYFVAAAIFVASIAGAVWIAIARTGGMTAGLTQIVVPGGATLELKTPGTYTIFHERTSQVDGRVYESTGISGMRVAVRSVATGKSLVVRSPSGSSTYNFGGRSGRSVLAFDVDQPGAYELTAGYDDGRREPRTVLAVGSGFLGALFATIALSMGIAFAGIAAALLIAIITLLRRRRALRAAGAIR